MINSPKLRIVIVGAGGLGREVLQLVRDLATSGSDLACTGFFVEPRFSASGSVDGVPVLRDLGAIASDPTARFVLAIGDPSARARFAKRFATVLAGRFASLVHPSARIGGSVAIGEGSIILPLASLTVQIRVGRHVLINPQVSISHDCVLGDFATLAPAVALAGGVHIEEGAELGIGAKITPRVHVGRWSVVGAGATVIRAVDADTTVVGVPARVIRVRQPGWHEACPAAVP